MEITVDGIATSILAFTGIIAAIIALRQYREIGNARQAEILLWVFTQLDRLREERRSVFQKMDTFTDTDERFSSMPNDLRKAAENVGALMDYLGLIVKNHLVRKGLALQMCLEVVINLWEVLEPFTRYRRKQRGQYWIHFEDLYNQAKKYQQKHKLEVKRFKE